MLQPRIPLRRVCAQCKSLYPTFRRSYAQAVEPRRPSSSLDPTSADGRSAAQDRYKSSSTGQPGLRRYVPRTPGLRHLVRPINDHLWRGRPLHRLTIAKKGQARGGRNHTGRVVVRHRGGGAKRRIRTVDFDRWADGAHFVERIEHAGPAIVRCNRSGRPFAARCNGWRVRRNHNLVAGL